MIECNFYVLFQFFRSIDIAVCCSEGILYRGSPMSDGFGGRNYSNVTTKEVSWKTLRQNHVRSARTRGAGSVESFLAT
jgi:hypothetical protein